MWQSAFHTPEQTALAGLNWVADNDLHARMPPNPRADRRGKHCLILVGHETMAKKTQTQRFRELRAASHSDRTAHTIVLAQQYLADFPDHGPGWLDYGIALVELRRYAEARRALNRALRLCPEEKCHIVYAHVGHLYDMKGNCRKAAEWYKKSIALCPDQAGYHIYLGATLAKHGNLEEAEACHRRATVCSEGCIDEAYLNLGFVLRAKGQYREALACFEKALEIDPKYREAKLSVKDVSAAIAAMEHNAQQQAERDAEDRAR